MTRLVAFGVAFILVFGLGPPAGAASDQDDVQKAVFVHYRSAPPVPDLELRAARVANCPDPTTCEDHKWQRLKWDSNTITYELNAASAGVSASTAGNAVTAAFAAWTRVTGGGITMDPSTGTTACSSAGVGNGNRINQICWRPITEWSNVIAVTYVWYSRSRQILEADVVFNTADGYTWSYTDPGTCGSYSSCNSDSGVTGKYDIRDIGTHEFGHFLAFLGDLYGGRDTEMTMYGYGSTNEVKKDSLAKGDCLGITDAYGGSCP